MHGMKQKSYIELLKNIVQSQSHLVNSLECAKDVQA